MNESKIYVEPKEFTTIRVANYVSIRIVNLKLGEFVECFVNIYEENNNNFETKLIRIDGEEYDAWGNDDNYLLNLLLSKVGLIPKTNNSNN